MQTINPDTIEKIGRLIAQTASALAAVQASKNSGNTVATTTLQGDLQATRDDYELAISQLDDTQRQWVQTTFADALKLAEQGKSTAATRAVYLAQIKWADDQARELETVTDEIKAARKEWTKGALSYEVSAYEIAKLCDRTPSTVQRWT